MLFAEPTFAVDCRSTPTPVLRYPTMSYSTQCRVRKQPSKRQIPGNCHVVVGQCWGWWWCWMLVGNDGDVDGGGGDLDRFGSVWIASPI